MLCIINFYGKYCLNYVLMQMLLVAIVKLYALYSTIFMTGFRYSDTLVLVSVLVIFFFFDSSN